MERFFGSLKREWTGDQLYPTRQAAIADVREYVAVYYNAVRLHSTLGNNTPMEYENPLNKLSTKVELFIFNKEEKAILLMRYIRRHIKNVGDAKDEQDGRGV